MTLRKLLEEHPEWADVPMVVYQNDGEYEYVSDDNGRGGSASVYEGIDGYDEMGEPLVVLVFAGN